MQRSGTEAIRTQIQPSKPKRETRIDVYETLCPQQMLVHKGGKIKNWGGECRDVTPSMVGGGGRVGWGVRVDVNEELKFLGKFTKNGGSGGGGWVGGSGWWGGQGGCERRIEYFVKNQKKIGGGSVVGSGGGGSGWM